MELKGRRIESLREFFSADRQPGDYAKATLGDDKLVMWYVCDPFDALGGFAGDEVTEHEDGTITVSAAALDTFGFSGQLDEGVWSW